MPASKNKNKEPKVKESKTLSAPPIHLDKYLRIHSDEYTSSQCSVLMTVFDRHKMRVEEEWRKMIHTELTRDFT